MNILKTEKFKHLFHTSNVKITTQEDELALKIKRLNEAGFEYFLTEDLLLRIRRIDTKEEWSFSDAALASIFEDKCVCGYCERNGIKL